MLLGNVLNRKRIYSHVISTYDRKYKWHYEMFPLSILKIYILLKTPKVEFFGIAIVMGWTVSPPTSYAEVLSSSTSECDCIWR